MPGVSGFRHTSDGSSSRFSRMSVAHVLLVLMLLTGSQPSGIPVQILLNCFRFLSRFLTIVYIWNLYQAFRDIQDRLTRAETRSREGIGDEGPSDSGDVDGTFSVPRDTPP